MNIFDRLKPIIVSVAILIAIGMAGNFIIDFPVVHKKIKQYTNKILTEATDYQIDFKAIQLNFLTTEVNLFGLSVKQKDNELLRASHIRTQVSLLSIFLGSPKLSFIDISELSTAVPIVVPEEDSASIVFWPPDFDIPVNKIIISNSSIVLNIRNEKEKDNIVDVALQDTNAEFVFNHINNWSLKAAVSKLNLFVRGRHVLRDLDVKTKLRGKSSVAESEYTIINGKEIEATGDLKLLLKTAKNKKRFNYNRQEKIESFILKCNLDLQRADTTVLGRLINVDGNENYLNGSAEINLEVPFEAAKSRISVGVKAHSNNAVLADFNLLQSDADLYITRDKILFSDVYIRSDQKTHASGDGELMLNDATDYKFNIQSKKLSFKKLSEVLNVDMSFLNTDLSTDYLGIVGTATPFKMNIDGNITANNMDLSAFSDITKKSILPECNSDFKLRIDSKKLSFPQDILSCKHTASQEISDITLKGDIYTDGSGKLDITLDAESLKASLLEHIIHTQNSGEIDLITKIGGTTEETNIEILINSNEITIGNVPISMTDANLTYDVNQKSMKIKKLFVFENESSYFKLSNGKLSLDDNFTFETNLKANTLSENFIGGIIRNIDKNNDLSFSIRKLDGRVSGDLFTPLQYKAELVYEFGGATYEGENIFSIISGQLKATDNKWTAKDGYLRIGLWENNYSITRENLNSSPIKSKNKWQRLGYSSDEIFEFSMQTIIEQEQRKARQFSIDDTQDHLSTIPFAAKILKQYNMGSELNAQVYFKGRLNSLQGKVDLKLIDPFIFDQPVPSINISAIFDKGKVNIHTIKQVGNALLGSMEFDLSKPDIPYNWYFRMKQYDLRFLLPKLISNDPRNFVYLEGNWTMKGKLKKWWYSRGAIDLSSIHVNIIQDNGYSTNNITFDETRPVRFIFDKKGWRFDKIDRFELSSDLVNIFVKTKDNIPPEKLDIEIKGNLDLSIIEKLFARVGNSSGFIEYLLKITGSVENPDIYLSIKNIIDNNTVARWKPVSLNIQQIPPGFSNIEVDLELKDKVLYIKRLYAEKGSQGSFNITGTMHPFDESLDPILYVKANNLKFESLKSEILEEITAEISTDIIISGKNFPLNITGNVTIDSLDSRSDFDLRKQIVKAINNQKLDAVSPKKQIAMFKFDVNLKSNGGVKIKNKRLDLQLSSNLQLTGTDIAPVLLGKITADNGSFNYKRKFNITRGVVVFDEPTYPAIPSLDVLGETSIPPYSVEFMLTGKVNDPKVSLSVNPPTRDDGTPITKVDTVLLLATGELPEENPENSNIAAQNEIFSLLVGMGEEPLEKFFDLTGQNVIRQVYIDTYLSERTNRPVMRLTLPVNFFNIANILLQVDQDQNMKAIFAYDVIKRVSLNGYVENLNNENSDSVTNIGTNLGFDLRFKFSFE